MMLNIMNKGCHGMIQSYSLGYIRKTNIIKGYCKLWSLIKDSYFTIPKDCKIRIYNKSYQVEYDFYHDITPLRDYIGVKLPIIKSLSFNYWTYEYNIVMEDLSGYESYLSGVNYDNCINILEQMAKFHLFFLDNFQSINCWQHGGHWTDDKRDKTDFCNKLSLMKQNFRDNFNYSFDESEIIKIIRQNKSQTDNFLTKQNTIIHGDFKIGNFFQNNTDLYLIDFQWVGKGHCITDICYFVVTSLQYGDLTTSNCLNIIKRYMGCFPEEVSNSFISDFMCCLLDLFQYFVCYKWYNISPEILQYNREENIDGLHVRYFEQITSIINLVLEFYMFI